MVRKVKYEDLEELYSISKETKLFYYYPKNFYGFREEWVNNIDDSVVGIEDGTITGCGFIVDLCEGLHAQVHMFKNPKWNGNLFPFMREGIAYFFDTYDIEKLVGVTKNKAITIIWKRLGFTIYTPKLRSFVKEDGVWVDYWCGDILRSEVWDYQH